MSVRAISMGFQPLFSRLKALHLASSIAIVVAALILWVLLTHLPWYQLWKRDVVRDCIYLGRAGAHCTERTPSSEGDGSSSCQSVRPAGRRCAPEP